MSEITNAELRTAFDILISHLEEHGIFELEIVEDYYWETPQDTRYDNLTPPIELDVGRLTDDIQEVKRIATGKTPAIGFGLVWLSTVLRRIGESSPI